MKMKQIKLLAAAVLAALSLPTLALDKDPEARRCRPGQPDADACARPQRVRVEYPPAPAAFASQAPESRTVTTLPPPSGACGNGVSGNRTISSNGRGAGC